MKQILAFLIILILCSCRQQKEHSESSLNNNSRGESVTSTNSIKKENTENRIHDWEKHEDSLRNVILKRKGNSILKESFLQEMYIRNVVKVSKDSLFVEISFDLHGPDCGAPDCYATDISFAIKLVDTFKFPKMLRFQESTHGCIEIETKLTGIFHLIEGNKHYVIYYSSKHKRTLVLFSSNKETGTIAFYFSGLNQNEINGKNIYRIINDYKEDEKNSIYPITSWKLTTIDYEHFLK